mmetsp:Transcript_39577/g.112226  ORF Transcript_39577/g.112226 Transcript_39577/m.112226 type:complete len:208 (-) Transcript_39577:2-625(-)
MMCQGLRASSRRTNWSNSKDDNLELPSKSTASKSLRTAASVEPTFAKAMKRFRRTRAIRIFSRAASISLVFGPCHRNAKNSATSREPLLSASAAANTILSSGSAITCTGTFKISRHICWHSRQSTVFDLSWSHNANKSSQDMDCCNRAAFNFRLTLLTVVSGLSSASASRLLPLHGGKRFFFNGIGDRLTFARDAACGRFGALEPNT